mmetsp:Transcript_6908/g.15825  ORF Transcript_6908/g.15825 Transcript_6908/m.15825 type:complete len:775 (+) Transcript_6908:213-2537(+)|eukprot:CAMPEP_0172638980 /NCGR_PEP_ID=MMETSP1068-20121228/216432_1 /TAXON_ID=35684 /ORGANISM="Pseudopedinella elastica, Strain CCMP716" /LENGTH=774 /DNA_ID=CAMNT_0013451995 /DNA_START=117 /DNA_END=2441 /DNA_ORIENTATION=+
MSTETQYRKSALNRAQRQLRNHSAKPTYSAVLFGLSFERASDMVRIEALLQSDPEAKVVSVSLHPEPEDQKVLGALIKYYPVRYEHVETNFREERGLRKIVEKIRNDGLPARGYLDYAWLQTNYYKEKPQGYGMNWLPMKREARNAWDPGKIQMLFEAGITEFLLPMDVGGNAQEMLQDYIRACEGAFARDAPRLALTPMTLQAAKAAGEVGHALVRSDIGASRLLCGLARDPTTQISQFLDKERPFYRIRLWDKDVVGLSSWPPELPSAESAKQREAPAEADNDQDSGEEASEDEGEDDGEGRGKARRAQNKSMKLQRSFAPGDVGCGMRGCYTKFESLAKLKTHMNSEHREWWREARARGTPLPVWKPKKSPKPAKRKRATPRGGTAAASKGRPASDPGLQGGEAAASSPNMASPASPKRPRPVPHSRSMDPEPARATRSSPSYRVVPELPDSRKQGKPRGQAKRSPGDRTPGDRAQDAPANGPPVGEEGEKPGEAPARTGPESHKPDSCGWEKRSPGRPRKVRKGDDTEARDTALEDKIAASEETAKDASTMEVASKCEETAVETVGGKQSPDMDLIVKANGGSSPSEAEEDTGHEFKLPTDLASEAGTVPEFSVPDKMPDKLGASQEEIELPPGIKMSFVSAPMANGSTGEVGTVADDDASSSQGFSRLGSMEGHVSSQTEIQLSAVRAAIFKTLEKTAAECLATVSNSLEHAASKSLEMATGTLGRTADEALKKAPASLKRTADDAFNLASNSFKRTTSEASKPSLVRP